MMASSDIASSVLSIIVAFTNGLDVFKKLRERRRKKKGRQSTAEKRQRAEQELQLSNSLRRGPQDIQYEYQRSLLDVGHNFAKGDAKAHASLTETLLKLNSGLVGIISLFLHGGRGENLDYQSLTSISNSSREDALHALGELRHRLSQPRLAIQPSSAQQHACCAHRERRRSEDDRRRHSDRVRDSRNVPKPRAKDPAVARVPKSTSRTELVLVRPRQSPRRLTSPSISSGSTMSTTSSALGSPGFTSCCHANRSEAQLQSYVANPVAHDSGVALPSPVPHVLQSPRQDDRQHSANTGHRRKSLETRPPVPQKLPLSPPASPKSTQRRPSTSAQFPASEPSANARRRLGRATPSAYSFASASTKLGEIPMRRWDSPYDFEAMEKLNTQAERDGWRHVSAGGSGRKPKSKGKFMGIFRRGTAA